MFDCYRIVMRTILELDDNLLATAKKLARKRGVPLGQLISEFTRQSLVASGQLKVRNGAMLLEPRPGAPRADLEFVNKLRDEE